MGAGSSRRHDAFEIFAKFGESARIGECVGIYLLHYLQVVNGTTVAIDHDVSVPINTILMQ